MFSAAAWTDLTSTGWSQASNQNMTSRISNSEVITSFDQCQLRRHALFAIDNDHDEALIVSAWLRCHGRGI